MNMLFITFITTVILIISLIYLLTNIRSKIPIEIKLPNVQDIPQRPLWESHEHWTDEETRYRYEQTMRMSLFKVGNMDLTGDSIQHVFAIGDEYVIYGTNNSNLSDSIKVRCDSILERDTIIGSRYNGVKLLYGQAKGLLYKVKDDVTYKSRIAMIVSHGLSLGNLQEANGYLKDIICEIYADSQERYLNSLKYLITVILLVLSLVFLSVYTRTHPCYFADVPLMRCLIYVSTAGAIGGMISVSLRLRRTTFEKEIPPYAYALFAFERVTIAILAAYIAFLAIKNGISFQPIADNSFGYSLYGILAGFSETFIPGFLSKLQAEREGVK